MKSNPVKKGKRLAVFSLLILPLLFLEIVNAADTHKKVTEPYAKGMYVILNGDRIVSTLPDDGAMSVTVLVDGRALQFDIPTYAMEHLASSGVNPKRIDHLFLTHLHADHILGFPEFAFWRPVWGAKGPMSIYGPVGTQNMAEGASRFNAVHIKALQAFKKNTALAGKKAVSAEIKSMQQAFSAKVTEIKSAGVVLETDSFKVTATTVLHSVPSFAYRVDSKYGSVVISGDTAPSLNVVELAKNADLLIHEATMSEATANTLKIIRLEDGLRDSYPTFQSGHTSSLELGKIAAKANVKKLVAYHLPVFIPPTADQINLGNPMEFSLDQFGAAAKNDFIAEIKAHYDGPFWLAEPKMVFQIGKEY